MRRAVLLGLVGLLGACRDSGPPTVVCASTPGASGPGDTLAVSLTLGAAPPDGEADVLVRVDPLSTRGALSFSAPPPPTAGAVSLALTADATFQGCANASPGGFRLHADEAPVGRLWIRVSSDRPVVVQAPRLAPPGAVAGGPALDGPASLTILPGSSGRARWRIPPAPEPSR